VEGTGDEGRSPRERWMSPEEAVRSVAVAEGEWSEDDVLVPGERVEEAILRSRRAGTAACTTGERGR